MCSFAWNATMMACACCVCTTTNTIGKLCRKCNNVVEHFFCCCCCFCYFLITPQMNINFKSLRFYINEIVWMSANGDMKIWGRLQHNFHYLLFYAVTLMLLTGKVLKNAHKLINEKSERNFNSDGAEEVSRFRKLFNISQMRVILRLGLIKGREKSGTC